MATFPARDLREGNESMRMVVNEGGAGRALPIAGHMSTKAPFLKLYFATVSSPTRLKLEC